MRNILKLILIKLVMKHRLKISTNKLNTCVEKEKLLNRMLISQLLGTLSEEEKRLITLRYFENKTQVEIARLFGISQVQVSRLEKKILRRMRDTAGEA